MSDTRSSGTSAQAARGRGCGTLFLGVFLLLGTLFTVVLVREILQTALTYGWGETVCEILASDGRVDRDVPDDAPPYLFSVSYRYEWQGRSYTSDRFGQDRPAYDDWSKIRRLEKRYPVGSRTACRVNPADPRDAALELRGFWMILVIPLPLVFVLIGGGGIYAMWFRPERVRKGIESISAKAPRPQRTWLAPVLFAFLLVAGAGIFLGLVLRPAWEFTRAGEWRQVPCRVEFSRVGEHEGDDSTTYSVDILFSYEVNGERFRSSRFRFIQASSSGYSEKRDIVRQYPTGAETVCYVDPADPEQAVLDRAFPAAMLLGLTPLAFMLVGGGGLLHQLRPPRAGEAKRFAPPLAGVVGPVVLEPKLGRWGKLAGVFVFACVWNGIVSVFLWQVIGGWRRGSVEMFLAIFLIPFVLVGIASIGAVLYCFVGLFSPRVRLELSSAAVRPGGSAQLACSLLGSVSAVSRLRVWVEGREETTFRKGDSNRTETHSIAETELLDLRAPMSSPPALARVSVPFGAMHTYEGEHNKIAWLVRVRAEVSRGADIDLEFPFRVLPPRSQEAPTEEPNSAPRVLDDSPLRIHTRRSRFEAGTVVDGTIEWRLPAAPKSLELRLFWYTTGQGDEDVEIASAEQFGDLAASGRRPFRLTLPDAPVSYFGRLFSIHWALELVAHPGGETARVELQVG